MEVRLAALHMGTQPKFDQLGRKKGPGLMAEDIDVTLLSRQWIHSHEDDEPGRMVFRPADHPFPPSRGRRSMTLQAGGEMAAGGPGPDDRTSTSRGSWSLQDRHLNLDAPGFSGEFDIEQVAENRLVLRRRTPR